MKIPLKEIISNPYRDMKRYPIDDNKVDHLVSSIKKTGFWDNIVARKNNGNYEIAYGHHRLIALKKIFNGDELIQLIVKDIPDETMIKIMADENDECYGASPAVINETVLVAKKFLEEHPDLVPKPKGKWGEHEHIASFLGWKPQRCREALEALGDIENGIIDKKVYEGFKTQYQADKFRKIAKKAKLNKNEQRNVLENIQKNQASRIEEEILQEKYGKKEIEKEKQVDFVDYIYKDMCPRINKLDEDFKKLEKYREYIKDAKGYLFWKNCKCLNITLNQFLTMKTVREQLTYKEEK